MLAIEIAAITVIAISTAAMLIFLYKIIKDSR